MCKVYLVLACVVRAGHGRQINVPPEQGSSLFGRLNTCRSHKSTLRSLLPSHIKQASHPAPDLLEVIAMLVLTLKTTAAFNLASSTTRIVSPSSGQKPSRLALHRIRCCEVPPSSTQPPPPEDTDAANTAPSSTPSPKKVFEGRPGSDGFTDDDPLPLGYWLFGSNPRRAILPTFLIWGVIAPATNLGGFGSFLASLNPDLAREKRLDTFYPVGTQPRYPYDKGYLDYSSGFKRYVDETGGRFEFRHPALYVQDLTVYLRNADRGYVSRSVDPQNLMAQRQQNRRQGPLVAFGPPGETGEENLSVVSGTVPPGFTLKSLGSPSEAAERLIQSSIAKPGLCEVALLDAFERPSAKSGKPLYQFEYKVNYVGLEGKQPTYTICVVGVVDNALFTFASRVPSTVWQERSDVYREIANSFVLL